MKTHRFISWIIIVLLAIIGCGKQKPTQFDGSGQLNIVVIDTANVGNKRVPVANARVIIQSMEYDYQETRETDALGFVQFTGLFASRYKIMTSKNVDSGLYLMNLSGTMQADVLMEDNKVDTLICHKSKLASYLVINEIYATGPISKVFYVYDQYIELYNRGASTLYLDGILVARLSYSVEISEIELLDYVEAVYCYQFPGKPFGRQYPIQPGEFVVLAQDAYDHSSIVSTALNLENADWEFYDQWGADIDNFNVPNLCNIRPDKPSDFLINTDVDRICVADGSQYSTIDGYIRIPIDTILDGVEYSKSISYTKRLTIRIDAGYAGIGIQKYSGKSLQRIEPGYDTNNSTLDFEILDTPTPGRQ